MSISKLYKLPKEKVSFKMDLKESNSEMLQKKSMSDCAKQEDLHQKRRFIFNLCNLFWKTVERSKFKEGEIGTFIFLVISVKMILKFIKCYRNVTTVYYFAARFMGRHSSVDSSRVRVPSTPYMIFSFTYSIFAVFVT